MLTRRSFTLSTGALAAGAIFAPSIVRAAPAKLRCGLASGVNDAQIAFQTIPGHPKLHWYQDQNVDVEIVNSTSTSQPIQLLTNGQLEFATTSAPNFLPVIAQNPDVTLVSAYMWMPRVHNQVMVKPDSPYQKIADLKGKTIGIRNTGDSGYFFLQSTFAELGIDPQKDVEWISVGAGGPAGQALQNGTVEALAIWDAEFVRIGIAGFKLRQLPNLESAKNLFGNTYIVNRTNFDKNKEAYVKAFRCVAKGQIFTAANPRVATLLHWDLFPESKPKGKSDEQALAEMVKLLDVRKDKWFPLESSPDQRMGASTPKQWEASRDFVARFNPVVKEKLKDVSRAYTNEILDGVNKFDRPALEAEAKSFKV